MFDFSFYELLVFGVIALIVLGPEKLPQAVRTLGTYYAKFRRTVGTIKAEMEAELDLAETRQLMQEELAKIRQTEAKMKREMDQLRDSMQEFEQQQNSQLKQTLHSDSPTADTSAAKLDTPAPTQNINYLNEKTDAQESAELTEHNASAQQPVDNDSNAAQSRIDTSNRKVIAKAKRPEHDNWVHPVAGATPTTIAASTTIAAPTTIATPTTMAASEIESEAADPDTQLAQANADSHTHTNERSDKHLDEGWRLPMCRPWENMWFLLGDYDRAKRLPPAPFLPNRKANPLLNAITSNHTTINATTPSSLTSVSSSPEVNS
ncbi:Sec-independent protein translocase protein TatB [Psychrobacter lutiphocae]|uniref:Sec-independent protein translocase protein TatB n=1 Tax=Psychrobacter lutiphocae TaxID=540500 RepID=UPI00036D639B|nr:Sec-independent protein translocase protein TatB [Psychrobacter lutiphocae]